MFRDNINGTFPAVDPGSFRHQIQLLGQVVSNGTAGAQVSYQTLNPPVTSWAKIEYVRGSELISGGQDVSQDFLKLTLWYRPEYAANMRIQTPSGKQYIIQSYENVKEMNVYLILYCLGIGSNT